LLVEIAEAVDESSYDAAANFDVSADMGNAAASDEDL